MANIDDALGVAGEGIPVFPCVATGPARKRPYPPNGFRAATIDSATITTWWSRWPDALIGMPTGKISGRWVLDVDVKRDAENGFDSLEDLGHFPLAETPVAHTPSGGVHYYVDAGNRELRNSAGLIGAGLDVRGDGGYVILPSASSGYVWDPLLNFDTVPMAAAPEWLWPAIPLRPRIMAPPAPVIGLSRYGERAIELACDAISRAPAGQQERVLNAECFSIGTAAGASLLPSDIALRALLRAASAMPNYNPDWPWRAEEIDLKVRRAFTAGTAHPREARRVAVA